MLALADMQVIGGSSGHPRLGTNASSKNNKVATLVERDNRLQEAPLIDAVAC